MGNVVTSDYLSMFKGRRVFITGHTGFKGSWLAFLLNEVGAEVLGYALPPVGKKNHFELLNLAQLIGHVEADIRDGEKLTATMGGFKPEFVFHLDFSHPGVLVVLSDFSDELLAVTLGVAGDVVLVFVAVVALVEAVGVAPVGQVFKYPDQFWLELAA